VSASTPASAELAACWARADRRRRRVPARAGGRCRGRYSAGRWSRPGSRPVVSVAPEACSSTSAALRSGWKVRDEGCGAANQTGAVGEPLHLWLAVGVARTDTGRAGSTRSAGRARCRRATRRPGCPRRAAAAAADAALRGTAGSPVSPATPELRRNVRVPRVITGGNRPGSARWPGPAATGRRPQG
jgi:hypothetical protein